MVVGAAAVVVAVAVAALRQYYRKPEDPEDEEKRRRSQLNQVGRIVEGLVVELVESQAGTPVPTSQPMFSRAHAPSTAIPGNGLRRLVRYSYSVAGVTYETAQDVTGLEARMCLER